VKWNYKGRKVILIDTAGIEKNIKKFNEIEKKCLESTQKALKYSHVVICMIDALKAFQIQDISLS
jgi:GTP-binding protein